MNTLGRVLRLLALLCCLVCVCAARNQATQAGPGTITGTVHDSSGAVIPGISLSLTSNHGLNQTVTTDEQGIYSASNLPPGTYTVSVSLKGFKEYRAGGLVLAAGGRVHADVTLVVSENTQSLEVEGKRAAEVETENSQLSGTITQKEVTALMLNGRNFTQLIALAPGVSNQTGQDEALVGVKGSVKYSVNGGRVEYNNFDVDGSDVLNPGINGSSSTLIVYPSLDAIEDVKVLTSNYGAMYGRSASGTVLVTTKSGTKQFHGDAYEFIRNEFFNARNYFDQTSQAPLYRRNDFGFTLGGPLFVPKVYNVGKSKTFFFFSEEARLERTPQEFNQAVPSAAERNGDFSDVCPFATVQQQVYFTRAQFPDCPAQSPAGVGNYYLTFPANQVPIDPNAAIIMNTGIFPEPNSTSGCNSSIRSCYVAAISPPTYWREELFRIDHNFSPNLKWTGRYIHDQWNTTTAIPQWGYIQNGFPTVENDFFGPGLSAVTHLTEIITPTLVQDFVMSYTTDHIRLTELNGPAGTYQRPAGLTMGSLFTCPYSFNGATCFGGKIPAIVIGGTNAAYGGAGFAIDPSFEPYYHTNPTYSFGDDIVKSFGNHTLQFGAQAVIAQKNEVNPAIGAATGDVQGIVTFSNVNSFLTTGNSFADFLAGDIKSFQQDSAQAKYYNRYSTIEPYIQDDWKITPRLTINLGIRFSLFGTWHEKYTTAYNWEPQAYSKSLASQAVVDPFTGELLDVPSCLDPTQPSLTTCSSIPVNPSSPDPRLLNGLVQCGLNSVPASCMQGHSFNPAPRVGFAWDPRGDGQTSIRGGYGVFFEHGTGNEANTGSLEGSAPLVLDMTENFTAGYECIGSANASTCSHGAFPINVTSIPQKAVWPYVQQWNLSVQRQLTPNLVGSIAYVGSKGTHLTAELQANQIVPVSRANNPFVALQPLSATICSSFDGQSFSFESPTLPNPTPVTVTQSDPEFVNMEAACFGIQAKKLFPDPNSLRTFAPTIGQIFSLENVADSHYNAMQVTLRRSKGPLSLEVAYSYSHSIDDSSDRFDASFVNSYNLATNKASSNFDQRNLLNMSYVYDFSLYDFRILPGKVQDVLRWLNGPLGQPSGSSNTTDPPAPSPRPAAGHSSDFAESWIGRNLMEGWEFSGISSFQNGTPFSIINGGSAATGVSVLDNAGVANGTGAGSYPDVLPQTLRAPKPSVLNPNFNFGPLLRNPNMFGAPEGLTFGDAGRNFMNNPSRLNFDMAVLKHFKTSESTTLELRAEIFNVFNHTQFRIYNPDRGNTANNVISCYGGLVNSAGYESADPNGTNCLTGNAFLHPIDAHRPRTIQFGLKFFF